MKKHSLLRSFAPRPVSFTGRIYYGLSYSCTTRIGRCLGSGSPSKATLAALTFTMTSVITSIILTIALSSLSSAISELFIIH